MRSSGHKREVLILKECSACGGISRKDWEDIVLRWDFPLNYLNIFHILYPGIWQSMCVCVFETLGKGDFPGGPVAKTELPMQGTRVQSLIRKLNPTCCN